VKSTTTKYQNNDKAQHIDQVSPELLQQLTMAKTQSRLSQPPLDDEIDFAELWHAIWAGKWLIIAITAVFSLASIIYALSLPNIYKSEALLAPATEKQAGMSGLASKFGGLASLAGVNLGSGGGIDQTVLALEIMKSRLFIDNFINNNNLLVPLMATKGWIRDGNKLIYNAEIYDVEKNEWVSDVKKNRWSGPSSQKAFRVFSGLFNVTQDQTSSMITLSVEHYSPLIAKQWVDLLIKAINTEMKQKDLTEAENSITYLNNQLELTRVSGLQDVLYQLIEEQTQTIMFANVREQYALKVIDPAVIPELKSGPKRSLICVLGVFIGGMLAVMVVIIRYFSNKSAHDAS